MPPSWSQIVSDNSTCNLLSPTKNLLPAAANPLNPRTSPYFSSKRNMVVAPHPSELPLPSLSLTPKKNSSSENIVTAQIFMDKQKKIIDHSTEDVTTENDNNNTDDGDNDNDNENHNTPTKQCK